MAIEVEDVGEELGATSPSPVGEDAKPSEDNAATEMTSEELEPQPKAKARGRPRGSKNRPKAPAVAVPEELDEEEEVIVKRKPKKVVYISESEEEPPPSPGTQRRNEWAAYRQKQVNAHQARSAHYTKALDKMLAF